MTCMLRRKSKFAVETDVASVELRAEALAQVYWDKAAEARANQEAAWMRTFRAGIVSECAQALEYCRVHGVEIPKGHYDSRRSK